MRGKLREIGNHEIRKTQEKRLVFQFSQSGSRSPRCEALFCFFPVCSIMREYAHHPNKLGDLSQRLVSPVNDIASGVTAAKKACQAG
jgi:hypothetical protein